MDNHPRRSRTAKKGHLARRACKDFLIYKSRLQNLLKKYNLIGSIISALGT